MRLPIADAAGCPGVRRRSDAQRFELRELEAERSRWIRRLRSGRVASLDVELVEIRRIRALHVRFDEPSRKTEAGLGRGRVVLARGQHSEPQDPGCGCNRSRCTVRLEVDCPHGFDPPESYGLLLENTRSAPAGRSSAGADPGVDRSCPIYGRIVTLIQSFVRCLGWVTKPWK